MRKSILALAAAPFLLFSLACGASGPADGGTVTPATEGNQRAATPESGETAPAAAKVGQAVRDGKFEFTVTKIKCGVTRVGTEYFGQKAQGQFCLVTVKVSNIAKESQSFSSSSQKAFGADGAAFETDDAAGLYIKDNDTLFTTINPGNTVTGVLVFDIPKTAKLAKLELHDSPFSGGVLVTIK